MRGERNAAKMDLAHPQFESIHPVRTKPEYYRLLQEVRDHDAWEDWVIYMLDAVDASARHGNERIKAIREAFLELKHRIRKDHRFYSQDLLNSLFTHPYTKIQFIEKNLNISRLTATKYLDALASDGILHKQKMGRSNYYINTALYGILTKA